MSVESRIGCSFCNTSQDEVARLIVGPRIHICDRCVAKGIAALISAPSTPQDHGRNPSDLVYCSFCGKKAQEGPLTGNSQADICGECLVKSAEFMIEAVPPLPISRK